MPDFPAARAAMVQHQLASRGVRDTRVLKSMGRVPRDVFLPESLQRDAYTDGALPIACNQTISQPIIVAMMTEALQLSGDEKVLEIGTGSGYQAAILAELAGEVFSIERHAELTSQAETRLHGLGYQNIHLQTG